MGVGEITIAANWAMGLFLATIRVAAFTIAVPMLGQIVPTPAKIAFSVGLGWFLVVPVSGEVTLERLLALGVMNAGIGYLLGWMLGVLFFMFASAGTVIDTSAGTAIASVIDPTRGEQSAVFSRLFQIGGLALFHALGGLSLLATVLVWSTRAVPLDGTATFDGGAMANAAVELVDTLMISAVEIALPVLAVLLLTEVTLGLAARFAPTANVFLLGLPLKTFIALSVAAMSVALFPEAVDGLLQFSRGTAIELLNALGGAG